MSRRKTQTASHEDVATRPSWWRHAFPLIRHLSWRVTSVFVRLPLTPNQITTLSLAAGLGCAWCFSQGERMWGIAGAALLVVSYVLDNCDGEVARIKGLASHYGHFFDSFTDWVVDSAFFAALGYGVARQSGEAVWLGLGLAAAAGATVNYVLVLAHDSRARRDAWAASNNPRKRTEQDVERMVGPAPGEILSSGWKEAVVYTLRELSRADFCFIVLALSLFDLTWLLLPAGAIGAQAYWVMTCVQFRRKFHT